MTHYTELTRIQRNALIAQHIEGWQWIPYDFHDSCLTGQIWLLPDTLGTLQLTSGEWTYYLEEEEVYPDDSPFPLPHQDKRYVPGWLPGYFESLELAFDVASRYFLAMNLQKHESLGLTEYAANVFGGIYGGALVKSRNSMKEAICLAMLKARGVIDSDGNLQIPYI